MSVFLLLALASYLLLSSAPLMTSENPEYGQRAHFRRQLRRSFASRTLLQFDLGSLSDSDVEDDSSEMHSNKSSIDEVNEQEKDDSDAVNESSDGKDGESKASKGDKDEEGISTKKDECLDLSADTHPLEQDDEPQQSLPDVEAESPRPRLERALTKREAWQSIYHIHPHPKGDLSGIKC